MRKIRSRVLLCQQQTFLYGLVGSSSLNRRLLQLLKAKGHECHAFTKFHGNQHKGRSSLLLQIAREPLASLEIDEKRYVRFTIQGITVHSAARNAVVDTLTSVISQVDPEVIIISDESDEVLRTAIASGRKVIAVAH
mgnify:FL=1